MGNERPGFVHAIGVRHRDCLNCKERSNTLRGKAGFIMLREGRVYKRGKDCENRSKGRDYQQRYLSYSTYQSHEVREDHVFIFAKTKAMSGHSEIWVPCHIDHEVT